MSDLKPCPFCGGEAFLKFNDLGEQYSPQWVLQHSCWSLPDFIRRNHKKATLVRAWNTRPAPEPVTPQDAWQDISTAPDNLKVGDSALVFAHGYQTVALYLSGGWTSRGEEIFPTHWMPKPEPPQSGEGE